MTNWDALGGNPAPGEPSRILSTGVKECDRVAETALTAQQELERIKYEFSSSIWLGDAAMQFSKALPTVIEDLYKLRRGYGDVANALQVYANQLIVLQEEASTTLNKAHVAEGNIASGRESLSRSESYRDQSRFNRDNAEVQAQAREAASNALSRQKLTLQLRRQGETDPAQWAAIDQSINTVTAQLHTAQSQHRDAVNTLLSAESVLDDAVNGVRVASSQLSDAQNQFTVIRRVGSRIGDDHKSNAKRAAAAILDARGAAVGSTWDKFRHMVRESEPFKMLMFVLDNTADLLGTISIVCNGLALVPGLNSVFGPVAAALVIASTVIAVTQFLLKEFEGRSSGWERVANLTGAVLGVLGLKGSVSTLKQGWQAAGKLNTLQSAWNSGQANAVLGKKSLQQLSRDFKMMVKGTLFDAGTNRLRFTTFKKTIGGKLTEGSLKSISAGDIAKAIAIGKVTPRNVVDAYFGKRTVAIALNAKRYVGKIEDFFSSRNPGVAPSDPNADRDQSVENVIKIIRHLKAQRV